MTCNSTLLWDGSQALWDVGLGLLLITNEAPTTLEETVGNGVAMA
jgi:hypothetical protein